MQTSIDGFVADSNDSLHWMIWEDWNADWNWDEDLKRHYIARFDTTDTIVLSTKMAEEGFMNHWENAAKDNNDKRYRYATKINEKQKLIFSRSASNSTWKNSTLVKGDLKNEINNLKKRPGKDMIVYGGITFVSALLKARVIDEFEFYINPTVLGKGLTVFNELQERLSLVLLDSKSFSCGIVVNRYEPVAK